MKLIIDDNAINDVMYDMTNAAAILDMIGSRITDSDKENMIYGVSRLLHLSAEKFGKIADEAEEYKDNIRNNNAA